MRSNELRIGNWVMGNKPFQIIGNNISLYESREKAFDKGILQGKQLPEPIPLTEEWLVKFGFERKGCLTMALGDFSCESEEGEEWIDKFCLGDIELYDVVPKYVNQLQNLYFALTGKELIIKE